MATKCGFCGQQPMVIESVSQVVGNVDQTIMRCSHCKAAICTMDKITTNAIYREIEAIKQHLGIIGRPFGG